VSWRYSGLVLLLLLVSLVPQTMQYVLPERLRINSNLRPLALLPTDAESIFARGDRLPLTCTDVSTLEMIRGISDGLAFQLVAARERVVNAYLQGEEDVIALQRVHGIGPATAERLLGFIRLDGYCAEPHRFEYTGRIETNVGD
jgi:hypothetical protein